MKGANTNSSNQDGEVQWALNLWVGKVLKQNINELLLLQNWLEEAQQMYDKIPFPQAGPGEQNFYPYLCTYSPDPNYPYMISRDQFTRKSGGTRWGEGFPWEVLAWIDHAVSIQIVRHYYEWSEHFQRRMLGKTDNFAVRMFVNNKGKVVAVWKSLMPKLDQSYKEYYETDPIGSLLEEDINIMRETLSWQGEYNPSVNPLR